MAKWLRDYLSFGSRRAPPQPPARDYTESELLRAYRLQKSLDFEDPYGEPRDAEDAENRTRNGSVPRSALCSPLTHKHRLIKVDSVELSRGNVLLSTVGETREPVIPSAPLASDTDYSDPFDARPEACGRPDAVQLPAESCSSYMEPYEAQRVLTELQKGASCSRHTKGGVQLYDTPYEERTRVWRTRSGTSDAGRESKLPRDDERPADEYDQPWEWKKDNISKAFAAVQFAGADRERHIPSLDRHQSLMSNTSQTAGTQKYRKHADAQTPLGERVDPTLALEKQVWYHGALSRSEAESLLTLCKECSYLVRKSQSCHSDYSLSIRSCQGFMHMKFTLSKDGKFILGQNSPPFGTIPEVIHYYTTHKLPIRGAEHMSLLYPVLVQTL